MRRLRPVVTDVAWSVYPSVCTCDCTSVRHNRESYQTAKLIKVPFGLALEETIYTVGSFMRNSVLGRHARIPMEWGNLGVHVHLRYEV